jgi:hypothetical protein
MSKAQRISVMVSGVLNMALLVAAQRSIAKTPDSNIRGKKAVWRAVSFINFFGPVSWFVLGRRRDSALVGGSPAKR